MPKKKKKKAASRKPARSSSKQTKSSKKSTSKKKAKKVVKRKVISRKSTKSKLVLPKALNKDQVFAHCPDSVFKFKDTSGFGIDHGIISQDRAVKAINLGLGIRKPGYNIYVAGIQGTGKTSVIRTFLEKFSKNSPEPQDWIYVYNFQDVEHPNIIPMVRGEGRKFKKRMEALVKSLKEVIPNAMQSEDYENAVNAYISASNESKSKLYTDLEKRAKTLDFVIKSNRMGIETIPVVDGRSISEKEYGKLSDAARDDIEEKRSQLEPEVLDFARKVRAIESETGEYVEKLRDELGQQIVGAEMSPIMTSYKKLERISEYLEEVKEHIQENLLDFVEDEESLEDGVMASAEDRTRFRKYCINVFVDNTKTAGAPVVIETNPTYYNLFGRVEKNVEHGMYLTDFTMVKSGALHRANGGYLVLNAMDVFKTDSIWETLKRVLKNRQGFIEDMGEQYSMLPTSGLRPTPVPLDLKVILIGNDEIYHLLYEMDEDFHKIFKIKADFDYKMPKNKKTINAYASFVATRSKKENLLPFTASSVGAVVEFGSRLVEDQKYLSTQFGELKDLTIESDFVARQDGAKKVKRIHVEEALNAQFDRVNMAQEHLMEMVKREDILLQVQGKRIGQVNGLAVYDMGDFAFGKIGRITCTISTSDDGVFNIERASKLSGKIHDKGMYILTGFLNAILAKERSIGCAASVCFEQSYGMIDGDSASVAELVAIISAMAKIPVDQSFAMTGSLNQFGDVQPIGGVNEKVEGFYRTCQILGKGKNQVYNIMVPYQNVDNLMLQEEVRDAVKAKKLNIYPIRHISEAFEIVTGVPLGMKDILDTDFAEGSALAIVQEMLNQMHADDSIEETEVGGDAAIVAKKAAQPRLAKRRMKTL